MIPHLMSIHRHRLSTIMNADRIVVVEQGKVVEQGSHSELIVANGRYADLWSKQVFLRPSKSLDIQDIIDDRSAVADDLSSEQTATEPDKMRGEEDFDSEAIKTDEEESESSETGVAPSSGSGAVTTASPVGSDRKI